MTDNVKAVSDQLYAWLTEAVNLRHGPDPEGNMLRVPDYEEGSVAFITQLLSARQRADRIEELMVQAKRVRRKVWARQKDAADALEDKFDAAVNADTAGEYTSAMQRKASASLQSFEEKRAARQAQRLLDTADEVVDALKDIHFGLSGWRNDIRDVIRSYQFESNLER